MSVSSSIALLSSAVSGVTGTAIDCAKADVSTIMVTAAGNTGVITVAIEGSVDGGSTYGVINSTTLAGGAAPYFVTNATPYSYIRAKTSAGASTATLVSATGLFQQR